MRSLMLNLFHATREVLPPSMDGDCASLHPITGPHPWIYSQVAFSIFKSPQAFISSPHPLFHDIGPPEPWIFHPIVDYPQVTGSTSMCKDPWMGIIHESSATGPAHVLDKKLREWNRGPFAQQAIRIWACQSDYPRHSTEMLDPATCFPLPFDTLGNIVFG